MQLNGKYSIRKTNFSPYLWSPTVTAGSTDGGGKSEDFSIFSGFLF